MSAENLLTMRRMSNGQFWAIDTAAGNTVMECHGSGAVFAKCDTYKAAAAALELASSEDLEVGYVDRQTGNIVWTGELVQNDAYRYSEHGVEIPLLEVLMREPPTLIDGTIHVEFSGRTCACCDERDLNRREWRVVARCSLTDTEYVLGNGLRYTRAVNLAQRHLVCSGGDVRLVTPCLFRRFENYPKHSCDGNDYWAVETEEHMG